MNMENKDVEGDVDGWLNLEDILEPSEKKEETQEEPNLKKKKDNKK